MLRTLYEKTKGYKSAIGFTISFICGGLVWTGVIDETLGMKLVEFGTLLLAFGLGDKAGRFFN